MNRRFTTENSTQPSAATRNSPPYEGGDKEGVGIHTVEARSKPPVDPLLHKEGKYTEIAEIAKFKKIFIPCRFYDLWPKKKIIDLFIILCLLCLAQDAGAQLTQAALKRLSPRPVATRYEIEIVIDPARLTYKGHEKVTFSNYQPNSTNYLLFFLYPNDPSLTKIKKKLLSASNVQVNHVPARFEEKGPSLRIFLEKALQPGDKAIVDLDLEASVPAQSGKRDLFTETVDQLLEILDPNSKNERDYGIFSSSNEILNLGLWYATLSKYDQIGWDEEEYSGIGDVSYFDPADFQVKITAPGDQVVVTTGSLVQSLPVEGGRILHEFDAKETRDFAVELSPKYREKDSISGRTTIRTFYIPEHEASGEKVLHAAVKAFAYYEKVFGEYPYKELDIVEAPLVGGAGGVEFPGLVTISSMLYKNDQESEEQDQLKLLMAGNPMFEELLEFVVAHEVAHQWWNAVVGSNSKKYPFIDEAMANYSAVLYFEHTYGRKAAEKQMAMQMKINYQVHRMVGGSDQPVLLPASAFHGPLEYAAIVYGKGALYFDRLRSVMGDSAFFGTLRAYYNRFWFGIAGPDDFTRIAKQQAPLKKVRIDGLYERWMNGVHGDEDIAPGTLQGLMETMLSVQPEGVSEDRRQLLDELQKLLKQ
jgi:hypothetical protein